MHNVKSNSNVIYSLNMYFFLNYLLSLCIRCLCHSEILIHSNNNFQNCFIRCESVCVCVACVWCMWYLRVKSIVIPIYDYSFRSSFLLHLIYLVFD